MIKRSKIAIIITFTLAIITIALFYPFSNLLYLKKALIPPPPKLTPDRSITTSLRAHTWLIKFNQPLTQVKAQALIKDLRQQHYAAFAQAADQSQSTLYYVLIGPEIKRSQACGTMRTIQQQTQRAATLQIFDATKLKPEKL